jgi:nucleoid DNA-binding protein
MLRKRLNAAEVVGILAQKTGMTEEQVKVVLNVQAETAYERAAEGYPIPGIGVFKMNQIRERKTLLRFGPNAGQESVLPAKRLTTFRVSRVAKEMIAGGDKPLPDLFQPYVMPDLQFSSEAKVVSDPSAFIADLGDKLTLSRDKKPVTLIVYRLADFWLPSGRIVAGDLMVGGGRPFVRAIPAGRYPLALAAARIGTDERIAFAILRFSRGVVAKWEVADTFGENPISAMMKKKRKPGYGVDSGTGSFYDASVQQLLDDANDADAGVFEQVMEEMKGSYESTRSWVHIGSPNGSIAVFSSGFGDGYYSSYFGLDARGEAAMLVTDFGIVDWKNAEHGAGPVLMWPK